jgi:arylsulfatase A-like enzyme
MERFNVVVVILDTLRYADVGCYGNSHIKTPHMDALAKKGVKFTNAYPESLPTIPVRRAVYTGRRAYPFREYKPLHWGTVYLPGWQPISEEEDTLAENIAAAGYQTGYVCTTQHCWNPGFNFWRGFWQWEFVRGYSGEDRWQSPFSVAPSELEKYGDIEEMMKKPHLGNSVPMVLANRGIEMKDEETATAKAFKWASKFVKDNREEPFYLLIDSFAPHEPWQAPEKYYSMYGDSNYSGVRHLAAEYGPADGYSEEEIAYLQAHYRGLVTHVDHWLGTFMDTLDNEGLSANTAVLLISDHGTNFCENPRKVIGKPSNSMYPGVMKLPFIFCLPGSTYKDKIIEDFVYNTDLTATVYDLVNVTEHQRIDGQSLIPLVNKSGGWKTRDYITCRYSHDFCYIDDSIWALGDIDGNCRESFDLKADPGCRKPLGEKEEKQRWEKAWKCILEDAGGELPDYRGFKYTDALGRERKRD